MSSAILLETGIPQDFMMLKPDQIADCTGYGLQDLMLLFIFNSAFIKMVASPPWRSAGSGWRRGKRMKPIFFHYLRLGCSGWLSLSHFRSKDRHNTDGQTGRGEV